MSFWYKSAENSQCHPNCSCQAERQGPWTSCLDFKFQNYTKWLLCRLSQGTHMKSLAEKNNKFRKKSILERLYFRKNRKWTISPQNELGQGQCYSIYSMFHYYPRVQSVTQCRSTISHFQYICNFFYFQIPLDPILNFNHFLFFFPNFKFQKSNSNFSMDCQRNSCKKKRILSAEEAAFWNSHFQENRKCAEWPQHDLERYKPKGTPYMLTYCLWIPHVYRFALRLLVFKIIEVFASPMLFNSKLKFSRRNR